VCGDGRRRDRRLSLSARYNPIDVQDPYNVSVRLNDKEQNCIEMAQKLMNLRKDDIARKRREANVSPLKVTQGTKRMESLRERTN
jgi:hypothetical protein